jgi:hypothetical protein
MGGAGSSLLLDEYFAAGDARFLDELLRFTGGKKLLAFAPRFYADRRPLVRRALLDYIDDGCDRDHHRPLVKKLFKLAEAARDDEAMGHFLVACDRLVRRELTEVPRFDWSSRSSYSVWELHLVSPARSQLGRDPSTGETIEVARESIFSLPTRRYLRRRAWRYFRRLGYADPRRYAGAIRQTLTVYTDAHLARPEALLDAWGLGHALYFGSPVLRRDGADLRLKAGTALAQLLPAPFRPDVWMGCRDELLTLVDTARARTVRLWTVGWLRARYADELRGLPIARVRAFLRSPHDELQEFGAELLPHAAGLDRLPIDEWLALLAVENAVALPIICELVAKHVAPSRLTVEQCVQLACARPQAVAALGLGWLREKRDVSLGALLPLSGAEAPAVRAQGLDWLLEKLGAPEAKPEQLRELVDARHADVRARALDKLAAEPRFATDPLLWAALPESPYDDVRAFLVARLEAQRARLPAGSLAHVWATALLNVHRGGKQKPEVARQIAAELERHPAQAPELLPLLAIALRSLRVTERAAALAAVVRAVERRPSLAPAVARALPELRILDDAATARASVGG